MPLKLHFNIRLGKLIFYNTVNIKLTKYKLQTFCFKSNTNINYKFKLVK